jgi:glycosyltransferase involved in cell wall biosynthesis
MAGRGLSGEARVPLVSINIPCYNQLPLARRAVECVLAQSFTNIEVILHDDGASSEYERYVESLHDSRVHYQRNRERLGAMRNMFEAIESGRGKYTMSCSAPSTSRQRSPFSRVIRLAVSSRATCVNSNRNHPWRN